MRMFSTAFTSLTALSCHSLPKISEGSLSNPGPEMTKQSCMLSFVLKSANSESTAILLSTTRFRRRWSCSMAITRSSRTRVASEERLTTSGSGAANLSKTSPEASNRCEMNSNPEKGVRWTPSEENSGVEKLGRRCRFSGTSIEKAWENMFRISGSPSRYQMGAERYMGGAIMKETPGREEQTSRSAERASSSTGSTR